MNDNRFLISEQLDDYAFSLTESTKDTKDWYLRGVFGEAELVNRNNRKYPVKVMTEAVEEFQPLLRTKHKVLGEYNHPKSAKINSERACIQIQSLVMEGNKMIGCAKVLRGTTLGNHLIGLLENDIQMPVSTRALGKVTETGGFHLVENMKLSTVDVVDYQSCQTATPSALFESVNWMHEVGTINDFEADLLDSIRLKESSANFKQAMHSTHNNILRGLDNVVLRAYAKLGLPLR
jgi:hypothetical protein